MTREPATLRWCRRLVVAASWLVPAGQRSEWRQEWEAEVAHRWQGMERAGKGRWSARLDIVRRVAGTLPDAAWLRRQLTADSDLVHDLRHGLRSFRRRRAFAAAVVAVLALGLGSLTAVFTLVDGLLLRPLPYPEPERLMTLWESNPRAGEVRDDVAPADFLDWQQRSRSFESMAAGIPFSYDYTGGTVPEVFFAVRVTEGFFRTLGVVPALGRDFRPDEHRDGHEKVVLLDHAFWTRRFAADPGIVGRTLPLEGEAYTVVGVLPADFEPGLLPTAGPRGLWTPHVIEEHERQTRGSAWWAVVGRLAPGVTVEQARAEMATIAIALEQENPRTNRDVRVSVVPFAEHLTGAVSRPLRLLAVAAALVLLLASANAVGLLLARGAERERELAVRASLGAGRGRLVRQLLAETVVLGGLGALAGLLLARWAVGALVALAPVDVPRLGSVHLGGRALAFAAVLSIVTTLVCGAVAALAASRTAAPGALAGSGRTVGGLRRQPLRRGLVVAQVAAALLLLFGAALLARSFERLLRTDPGFRADGAAVLQVFAWDRHRTPAARAAFFRGTLARIEALPGVESAGIVTRMPFIEANIGIRSPFAVEGRGPAAAGQESSVYLTIASRGYFDAMRIPLRAGRSFEDSDRLGGAPVALVNDALARREWPQGNAVGSRVALKWQGRPMTAEVVGVVGSALHRSLDRPAEPEAFLSSEQVPYGSMTYVVRAQGAGTLIAPVQQAVWSVDPQQSFYRVATLDELLAKSLAPRRFLLLVSAAFACTALALAVAGLYGLVSFLTARRTQEIGVRVALGAGNGDIFRMVVGEGMALVGVGLGVGLVAAFGAGRAMESALFGVSPADPTAGAAVVLLLAAVAFAACAVPALRASRTDPIAALRND